MYRALYRKYRPATFSDVCGQEHITLTLKNQISGGKISHAYLFTGSRGTGKTSTAKILSKAVNCLNTQNGDPCCECEMCRGIDTGTVLDVVEIDAASNNGVDNIRDLRDNIAYAPVSAKYKVFIIDEVHMLTDGAFNALLKTLEEPPEHAIFILATTEVHKIPATVLSRCQRYDFNRISAGVIFERLKYICEKEEISACDDALYLIAKLADGGMRDAVGMLDLCAGSVYSGEGKGKEITEKDVANSAGLVDKDYIFEITEKVAKGDTQAVLQEINRLYQSSCDMERLVFELISHYRDLMIAKTSPDFRTIITATNEELDKIAEESKNLRFEHILHCVNALSDCVKQMKSGTEKRIAIETALIKLCVPSLDTTPEALLNRISALEGQIKSGIVANPLKADTDNVSYSLIKKEEPKVSQSQPAKSEEKTDTEAESSIEAVRFNRWDEVLSILRTKEPMLYSFMANSIAYTRGKHLLIDAQNEQFRSIINGNKEYYRRIREAVINVTGTNFNLGPYNKKAQEPDEKTDPIDEFTQKNSDIVESEE